MRPAMSSVVREQRMESRSASRFTGRRVHFIGIGGCGMSGLASMLLDAGAIVTGSEPNLNPQTMQLIKRGAKISRDQMGELLSHETDLVVRTAAVPDSNIEFKAAAKYGVETIKYAELLGQVMSERFGVAVAGTHGKSTTTAMIAFALHECGADPSFVVGGTVPQLGNAGSRSGQSDLFVAEACEYAKSFHHLSPKVALVTNIEREHLDCYRDIYDIIEAFRTFVNKVSAGGTIIANGRDKHVEASIRDAYASVETVSLTPGTTWSTFPTGLQSGCPTGAITKDGKPVGTLNLAVAGEHNLCNATMAVAACAACGVDASAAAEAVSRFTGVERRMQIVGSRDGWTVVDDYGHHPTEIVATLKALRQRFNPKRLICLFQPHQYSRTRELFDDFATSFADADITVVTDIYFVRDSEADRMSVSGKSLVAAINDNGNKAIHMPNFGQIVEYLKGTVRAGDLVVTMGAGNIWEVGRDVIG